MSVGDVLERADRPAIVRFKKVAFEDKRESLKQGHYVGKDVDIALITPPYSKDVVEIKVDQWLENMKQDVMNGRLPESWAQKYREDYKAWQNGQEVPLNGTGIRGWGVLSPTQQELIIRTGILTVEDLAVVNDEGMRRIGMGALEFKTKAKAWLAQLQDKGPLTQKIASVEAENANLKTEVESLKKTVERLVQQQQTPVAQPSPVSKEITASDILDEKKLPDSTESQFDEAKRKYFEKYGKKPHHKMKESTIREALK